MDFEIHLIFHLSPLLYLCCTSACFSVFHSITAFKWDVSTFREENSRSIKDSTEDSFWIKSRHLFLAKSAYLSVCLFPLCLCLSVLYLLTLSPLSSFPSPSTASTISFSLHLLPLLTHLPVPQQVSYISNDDLAHKS